MSKHDNNSFYNFSDEVAKASQLLLSVVNLFPKEVKAFEINSHGDFILEYHKDYTGSISHSDEKLQNALKGSSLKVAKVVKGTIDKVSRTIKFASGISGVADIGILKTEIALKEIKADSDSLEVTAGKWSITKTQKVEVGTLAEAQIEWA